jgi:hypothetical protein
MKLLTSANKYQAFVSLQEAVYVVEVLLHEVESLLQQRDEAFKRVRSHRGQPLEAAKQGPWHRKLVDHKVDLSFMTYAAGEALGALEESIDKLRGCVEKARQAYGEASPDLQIACGLNVLKSDSFRSRATELLLNARKTLFNAPPEEPGIFGIEFVARHNVGNRRQFTARFRHGDGHWLYVQSDQSDELATEIPAVPCMTQAEAREKAVELALRFGLTGHSANDSPQVYDIVTGYNYSSHFQ